MLRTLFLLLASAPVFAFNLYGAFLIFYETQFLKKAGLFALFMALARLAQYLQGLAYPAQRNYMVFSLLVFLGAAFTSLLMAAHRRLFHQVHQYQAVHNPKTWQTMMKCGTVFFAHLCPVALSVLQVLTLFH